jgi:hypothetical protein
MKQRTGVLSACIAAAAALTLLTPLLAHAQWVMVARKSMGAIQNMRSEHSDVATVLLEAPADKVYAAALRTLNEKEGARITGQDDAARTIDFSGKRLTAKMKVGSVDAKVSMITVTSPGTVRKSGDSSAVVDAILRVCREMSVECHESNE